MIMARTRSPLRRFSLGIISLRRRRPSTRPASTMMSPLSRRLTVPTKIFSPRDMKSLSSISRSASRIFCRITCLAAMRADAADRHRLHRFLDVLVDLDVGHFFLGFEQQDFLVGQLQAGLVGHDVPAAEGLVVAAVAVDRDADVHVAAVQLLGGLRQRGLDRAEDHVAFDVLLARDRIHQHQQFAIHCLRPPSVSSWRAAVVAAPPGWREPAPLEIHYRDEPRLAQLVQAKNPAPRLAAWPPRRRGASAPAPTAETCFFAAASARSAQQRQPLLRELACAPWNGSFRVISICVAGEALEIGRASQRPVETRRGHLEPLVGDAVDLEHMLQLARDLLAVVDGDELAAAASAAGLVDGHAQQPPSLRSASTRS